MPKRSSKHHESTDTHRSGSLTHRLSGKMTGVMDAKADGHGRLLASFLQSASGKQLALIAMAALIIALAVSASASRGGRSPTPSPPAAGDSFYSLLAMGPGQLACCDIARMNLLCAKGLPGAEGLDIERCLATLDQWAARVRSETDRNMHRFQSDPAESGNSPGFFRMSMLATVLQEDFGAHYDMACADTWDCSNSKDVFIHGLLGPERSGTCSSLPVLYVAVGRRLGYPLTLAAAKSHLFVRWDDGARPGEGGGGWVGVGERFNVDATSHGVSRKDDAYYRQWPEPVTDREIAEGHCLESMTPQRELAEFLTLRGHTLEDVHRLPEAQAAYVLAHGIDPEGPHRLDFLAAAIEQEQPGRLGRVMLHVGPERSAARPPRSRRPPQPDMHGHPVGLPPEDHGDVQLIPEPSAPQSNDPFNPIDPFVPLGTPITP